MGRVGLSFAGAPEVPALVALARRAEERGFESVWFAETRLTREAFAATAAIAAGTERALVGTGIVNVFTRGPVLLALGFATLAEIAPGRVLMGIGAGSPGPLAQQGIAYDRPLTRLRETVADVRTLLRGGATAAGARIEDELAGRPPGGELPLYLAVTAPKATELAGEVADGVLYNVCLPPAYVEERRPLLEAGAARAGRAAADLDVAMKVVVSPHEDSATGRDRARRHLALYLASFPAIAEASGVDAAPVRAAYEAGGLDAAAREVGDEVVDLLCAAGTPEECRARLDDYRAAGVDLPILVPVEGALELAVETLAD